MSAPSRRRIVVCADDFGITPAATRSILELSHAGAISATSVAVDGTAAAGSATELAGCARVSVGLHLALTDDLPGDPRAPLAVWIPRAFATPLRVERAVDAEITRQLDRFEQLLGRPPAYVDGHQHVHQFPGVRDALVATLERRYGRGVALRSTVPRAMRGTKAAIIAGLGGRSLERMAAMRGLAMNRDFAGVYDFTGRVPFPTRMAAWLGSIADGGLVMCHPETDAVSGADPVRAAEHRYLSSPAWPALLDREGIELVPFDAASMGHEAEVQA